MKIIVDAMPESAAKCKFHGIRNRESARYYCSITHKVCAMEENQTCRVCKPFHEMLTHYRL